MRCPQCRRDNSAGAKFCGECGARLALICPFCSTPNEPTRKFCGECGGRLEQRGAGGQQAAPAVQLPTHLAEKILTSRSAIEGERKQVTVLFADLKSSMELLADRDP